ncbi:glycosyltransferase family 24 protein [Pisolithus croceorrhizus]|nr:glycosyltransferase family 24 protein [Pisolithus croceorrhizus]
MSTIRALFAFLALGLVVGAHGASPPVTVTLQSSFRATDPLIEALETVAMEDGTSLFPLLSAFPLQDHPSTPRDAHTSVVDLASALMDASALASVRARLALHAASPRLAASAEHYDLRLSDISDNDRLFSTECASWVDWYGRVVCDADGLLQLVNEGVCNGMPRPARFPFDHVHSVQHLLDEPQYTAIHYADPTAPSFTSFHAALLSLEPKVEYVLRWARGAGEKKTSELSSYLSGYGVALDLKKMDYLVIDDRHLSAGTSDSSGSSASPSSHANTKDKNFSEEVLSCVFESLPYVDELAEAGAKAGEPLSAQEIADLGVKATQFLASVSSQPYTGSVHAHQCWDHPPSVEALLRTLSTSFPLYATSLARKITVSGELKDEVHENWAKSAPGANMVWVNGRALNEDQGASGNIFGILRTVQRERRLVKSLVALGMTREQAIELLMHPVHSSAQSTGSHLGSRRRPAGEEREERKRTFTISPKFAEFVEGLVDASDRQEGGDVIMWLNDLEKDPRNSRISPSLIGLLRVHTMSLFSPALQMRHNLVNVVFVLDMSQLRSFSILSTIHDNFVVRGYPVRWGFVPETRGEGLKMARLLYYIERIYGKDMMMKFIQRLLAMHSQRRLTKFSWDAVNELFVTFDAADDLVTVTDGVVPLLDEPTADNLLFRAQKYAKRMGVAAQGTAGKGHVFVNGRYSPLSDNVMRQIASEATVQLQILQEMVYIGEITDADAPSLSTFFYDLPSTVTRRNPYISVNVKAGHNPDTRGLEIFDLTELFWSTGFAPDEGSFVLHNKDHVLPITMYIIADLDTPQGIKLVTEALKFIGTAADTRITFVHNPEVDNLGGQASSLLTTLISARALSHLSPADFVATLAADDQDSTYELLRNERLASSATTEAEVSSLEQAMRLVARHLGLLPGERAILVNGRLVGPFDSNSEFLEEDFETLEMFEKNKRVGQIVDALDDVLQGIGNLEPSKRSDLIAVASSIIYADQLPDPSEVGLFDTAPKPRTQNYRLLSGNYTKFTFGDKSTALTQVALLLDPLSDAAQKWSSILEYHASLFPEIFIELHLNPSQLSEIPLKRFYRYNIMPSLQYDEDGQEIPSRVMFTALPEEPIYTLALDVPHSWLVRPRSALYDLDNIQLGLLQGEERARGVQALYALDFLVVEGHVYELHTNNPPRGVQLQLIDITDQSVVDDTQVVANLGYTQFKARPGTFRLEIRQGRGRTLYRLDSVGAEGWNSPSVAEAGDEITVMDFDRLTLYPRLVRRPGMEGMDVLDDLEHVEDEPGVVDNLLSKFLSFFKPTTDESKALTKTPGETAEINIFTVASGLLYERFASIMILSVLRNTKSTVKFWFIENFLSPSFLEFIPHMAKEYGFQYELVTYKWPSWLRPQKEKQRIIWAYKILFLDVLFPMDLKKVIFVDADQIVRADLKELVELDLQGAPYAYVPMGDDNYEMEGFRFWKTGYWRDFLKGRPYHISALYVVDLSRFRQMAAGDILRGQYQLLSADPNSLANLDQDLPNNLQREVPIYSLHEDWLWCETWCSKDRLHRAKTIDLCQNPLTKEPKLSRARQIPEWEQYDAEIAQFVRRLAAEGKIRGGASTADSKILARVGASVPLPVKNSGQTDIDDQPRTRDEL